MLKKIGYAFLLASSVVSSASFAMKNYSFQVGSGYEYSLPPNEPVVFSNVFMWQVKANCTIISDMENNPISFKVLKKSGSINETPLSPGDEMSVIAHPNDVFYIIAASGAKVELLNHSSTPIIARCAAA